MPLAQLTPMPRPTAWPLKSRVASGCSAGKPGSGIVVKQATRLARMIRFIRTLLALVDRWSGALPGAAHRLVELGVRLEERSLCPDIGELGIEERLLRVGDLEVDRGALAVAERREIAETLQSCDVRLRDLARPG